jgi:hypothetical protein
MFSAKATDIETSGSPRRGRKPKIPSELRRHNQTVRIRAATRQVLLEAARQNGRSMSEEIEARLEQSLRQA